MLQVHLRPWRQQDASSLAFLANNFRIADNLRDVFPHPYGLDDARRFISMVQDHAPNRILAIEVDGELVGGIGLHPQSDISRMNAELGYWLGEPYWGQGIGTQAVRQMVAHGFATLPIDRIFAIPFGSNRASQRVLEKAGFVLEGRFAGTLVKNGRREDELVYAVRKA